MSEVINKYNLVRVELGKLIYCKFLDKSIFNSVPDIESYFGRCYDVLFSRDGYKISIWPCESSVIKVSGIKYNYHYIPNDTNSLASKKFLNNNPHIHKIVKYLHDNKTLFDHVTKYGNLFQTNNYIYNYLSALTFLLCAKKYFPRDIRNIIANKILFASR